MNILCIIPARMGSSRFPGKPMEKILGVPMIEQVYRRVSMNTTLTTTVVATCDDVIADHVSSIGGRAIMTGMHHERASDRCAEALLIAEAEDQCVFDIVVMVQGDEPMVHPEMINEALGPMLIDQSILVTNLLGEITTDEEFDDRNCIKTVIDRSYNALYFSREPIPTRALGVNKPMGKQICVIPFRREFLLQYIQLSPTPLEIAESIDMMRVLENGFKVRMVPTKFNTKAVDTEEDRLVVESLLGSDSI
jgi:3-deoxy-manno-octulosonate cytidylyltransferase (CMP-KDO synthetase)